MSQLFRKEPEQTQETPCNEHDFQYDGSKQGYYCVHCKQKASSDYLFKTWKDVE